MELHNFAPDFDPTHPQVQQLVHNLQPTHITFLPDAHLGPTAPVGFAARTTRVCPSVIGGDAGCGFLMLEVKPVRVDFQALQEFLERVVPFQETPVHTVTVVQEFFEFAMSITQCPNTPTFSEFTTRRKRFEYQFRSSIQLSSLGSGNHFVEIGRSSTSGMMAVTVHSGSRNAGQAVYQQFQQVCQVFALHGVKCQTALFTKLLDEIHAGNQVHLPILLQGPFKRAVSARFRGGDTHSFIPIKDHNDRRRTTTCASRRIRSIVSRDSGISDYSCSCEPRGYSSPDPELLRHGTSKQYHRTAQFHPGRHPTQGIVGSRWQIHSGTKLQGWNSGVLVQYNRVRTARKRKGWKEDGAEAYTR
uniref:3'-phosphate/5'-hydroxy nucleic acid ligase n=1 Tax=Spironucleus salmonicida TaxID=348837 RepID=V6LGK4_9EUKA|eukprot:EST42826.1 hypothetical protein SS50377_17595 [Spironucleus salmonicida]